MTIICADPSDVVHLDELELLVGLPIRVKVGQPRGDRGHPPEERVLAARPRRGDRGLPDAARPGGRGGRGDPDDRPDHLGQLARSSSSSTRSSSTRSSAAPRTSTSRRRSTSSSSSTASTACSTRRWSRSTSATTARSSRRIKVMSELDIAEKRVPQDGRFKLRVRGRTIDFRVSIMPTVHGEDSVIRILDKESANAEFKSLNLEVVGFDAETKKKLRKFIREPYGMVARDRADGLGQDDDALRLPLGDPVASRTRSSRSRIRSSTSCAASRRFRSTRRRASRSRAACARSSATTPTRSWSARSATRRPRRSPCSRR